ncbi:hypothetical protein P5V15_001342 [Pogonomyrmex californicus]
MKVLYEEYNVECMFLDSQYVSVTLQIIRCIFLLMTLLIYACLPSLKNLHGKMLICHVIIREYLGKYLHRNDIRKTKTNNYFFRFHPTFCFVIGIYLAEYICFDIWWTFGTLSRNTIAKTHEHRKRFLLYCSYAWSIPLLLTILVIIADFMKTLPYYLCPLIGIESYSGMIFYIISVMILLISNIRFFILTSRYCNTFYKKVKKVTKCTRSCEMAHYRGAKTMSCLPINLAS